MFIRKIIFTILFIFLVGLFVDIGSAYAYVRVKGYYRQNGTYVQPYVRSSPNALRYDNYGYSGGDLYNSSYFGSSRSYSSSWYTPSWYTDSSYSYGRTLYKTKSHDTFNSFSYPSYSRSYSRSYLDW